MINNLKERKIISDCNKVINIFLQKVLERYDNQLIPGIVVVPGEDKELFLQDLIRILYLSEPKNNDDLVFHLQNILSYLNERNEQ